MNDTVQPWLQKAAASPGVLACGVRLADRSVHAKSCREEVSEQKVAQTLRELSEATRVLQQNRFYPERILWQFENGYIRCFARSGGILAAVIVTKEAANLPAIDQLLTDCISMFG